MDIADQSNDKGMFCFTCHLVPLVLYSVTTVVLYPLHLVTSSFRERQRVDGR